MPNLWGESDEEVDVILAQCNDGAHAGATIHCGSIDDEVIMSSHPDIKEHTPSEPTEQQSANDFGIADINAQNVKTVHNELCAGNVNSSENDKGPDTSLGTDTVHDVSSTLPKPTSETNFEINDRSKNNLQNEAKDGASASHTGKENPYAREKVNDTNRNQNEELWIAEKLNQISNCKETRSVEAIVTPDTTSDDSDPLSKPLAEYRVQAKCKTRRSVKRKIDLSFESEDDSDQDADYKPEKNDINSSDSDDLDSLTITPNESDEDIAQIDNALKLPKTKNIKSRDIGWKRKPKSVKTKRIKKQKVSVKKTPLHDTLKKRIMDKGIKRKSTFALEMQQVHKAKRVSKTLHTLKEQMRKYHMKRLDQLLASNELKRESVPSDGNCLFEAVCQTLKTDKWNASVIRQTVCDHMLKHVGNYIQFLPKNGEQELSEQFRLEVEQLKEDGQWKTSLADCLPLAIANVLNRPLRIFSSHLATPVYDIRPDIGDCDFSDEYLYLAHVAVRNEEHYEAVLKLDSDYQGLSCEQSKNEGQKEPSESIEGEQTSPLDMYNERNLPSDDTLLTPHKRAIYKSPKKKLSSRKKQRNPSTWKRNVRKSKRVAGQEYINTKGITVPEKKVKSCNCLKCRYKCNHKFSEDERQRIFNSYYSLASHERQRDFICQMVTCVTPKRRTKSKRKTSKQFYLVAERKSVQTVFHGNVRYWFANCRICNKQTVQRLI